MQLYFSPLACSLATRIALYEAGADAAFHRVDLKAHPKRVADGTDFLGLNPKGQVPVLRLDDGELLTENPVILQYVADRFPEAGLAPAEAPERRRLQSWLSFIGSELHVGAFTTLLSKASPEAAKAFALATAAERLAYLDAHLKDREFLQDRFSVADAYLVAVLNWTRAIRLDLSAWPAVAAYHARLLQRPSVARAVGEEFALYSAAA
ncbi:MAG: Glutathione S-transferase domain [Caulobacter sp.]|nr:Glutathione S-transferase domain [Caulobacter sp.]